MKQIIFSAILCFFLLTPTVFGASFYTDPATGNLKKGDTIAMPIRLAVDKERGECINAVDVILNYTENLNPVDISIGKSIFPFWIERPKINKDARQITFAGGIPNGYCGRIDGDPTLTNIMAEVIFRTTDVDLHNPAAETKATVTFAPESSAFLNDGTGEKANLLFSGSDLNIVENNEEFVSDAWMDEVKNDKTEPEDFIIELAKSPNEKYWIIFNTTDKQTGLSRYEVMEEPISEFKNFNWGRTDAAWVVANSPYILKDQSLNSSIMVKAVDKAGNETISTLIPKNEEVYRDLVGFNFSLSSLITSPVLIVIIILFGFGFFIGIINAQRKRQSLIAESETKDTNNQ